MNTTLQETSWEFSAMAPTQETNGRQQGEEKKPAAMPLFYSRPVPIAPETFKGKSLSRKGGFAFARKAGAVSLNGSEFGVAQRHYPIIFAPEAEPRPQAILGLRMGENRFVSAEGRWAGHAYVPAYVRRYPFIFTTTRKADELVLCADADSGWIVDGTSNPFFANGKPNKFIEDAGNFCKAFHTEHEKTRLFCAALVEQKLLVAKNFEIETAAGRKAKLGPFHVVDTARLVALPDGVVLDWHRRGWLAAIHAHILSLNNWADLAARKPAV
jgi:hypothetical protein